MKNTASPREFAYEALLAVERDGMQSHLVIRDFLQKMKSGSGAENDSSASGERVSARDRAFFLRLVEGTIEYRLQLDYIIDRYSKTKTQKMRPGIREILRMAVYQILYMDSVPDRAAVNEAVSLAVRKGFGGLRGFVNGVLRTIAREKDKVVIPGDISIKYSISGEITEAWMRRYGEEKTEAICRAFLEERPLTVHRFRQPAGQNSPERESGINEEEFKNSDGDQDRLLSPTGILDGAFFLSKGVDPAELPEFREGSLYIQDLSSQIAVAAAGIRPGDLVLDLCAAPGGKSLLAAERGARVLSRDLTEEKTELIRQNAERLGLLEACGHAGSAETGNDPGRTGKTDPGDGEERVPEDGQKRMPGDEDDEIGTVKRTGLRVETADAAVFEPAFEEAFDVVIADLPCSGFGVCGRKPEIKYKPYRETAAALAELQRQILSNAVRYVRAGGKLLYSTCTIAEEENEANVRWLLEEYGNKYGLRTAEISRQVKQLLEVRSIPAGEYGVQLLPCDGPWDGFFFSLLQRIRIS